MDNAIEIGQRIPPFVHGAEENPIDFLVAKEGITINVIPFRERNKHTLIVNEAKTRPDPRLPQSRARGQEPHMRSLDHLGRSGEAKDLKKKQKRKV